MKRFAWPWILSALLANGAARAECLTAEDTIATDRPTGPNASAAVPAGSVQSESGLGAARPRGGTVYDLPQARWRLGLAACAEFLVDLPDFTQGRTLHGASALAPGLKYQWQGLPEGLALWTSAGVGLPTGARALSGRGPAPYLQAPASYDLGGSWSVNGMYSVTFHPSDRRLEPQNQTSLYLDRTVGEQADLFAEFVNSYQHGAPTQNELDIGGSWRYAKLRQVDLRLGVGVNRAAPDWFVTVGYSLRFDHILY